MSSSNENEYLKKLAWLYNRGEINGTFFSFRLEAGEHRSYPTSKSAFVIPTSGQACFMFDHQSFTVKRGIFLHACPDRMLTISNTAAEPFTYVNMYYDNKSPMLFCTHLKNADQIVPVLEQIVSYNGSSLISESYRQLTLTERFFELLFEDIQPANISTDQDLLEAALQYIHDNYAAKITLPVLAEKTGTSAAHLSYLFEKKMNIRPIDYLIDYRLKKAIEILKDGESTVSETAAAVGYSDPAYFSRIFKKRLGFSPRLLKCI